MKISLNSDKDPYKDPEEEDLARESEEAETKTFEGDRGTLPLEIRSLLIMLLRGPFLIASEKPRFWRVLLDNKKLVLSELANLYLTLVIDEVEGIAFIERLNTGETETPSLLTSVSYTLLDSVLLVKLREVLMSAESTGQRASISLEEMSEVLKFYDPASSNDQVSFLKHVNAAVDRCCKRHFLTPLSTKGNYEINKIIKLLFTASDAAALAASYEALIEKNKRRAEEK